jgi:hypothetical protein
VAVKHRLSSKLIRPDQAYNQQTDVSEGRHQDERFTPYGDKVVGFSNNRPNINTRNQCGTEIITVEYLAHPITYTDILL